MDNKVERREGKQSRTKESDSSRASRLWYDISDPTAHTTTQISQSSESRHIGIRTNEKRDGRTPTFAKGLLPDKKPTAVTWVMIFRSQIVNATPFLGIAPMQWESK